MTTLGLASYRLGRVLALLGAVGIVVGTAGGAVVVVVVADLISFGGGEFSRGDVVFVVLATLAGAAAALAAAVPWFQGPEPALTVGRDELVVTFPGFGVPLRLPRHVVDAVLVADGRAWPSRTRGAADLLLWRTDRPNLAFVLKADVPTAAPPAPRAWFLPGWWRGGRPVRLVRIRVANLAEARFALSAWSWSMADEAALGARLGWRPAALDPAQAALAAAGVVVLSLVWLAAQIL